MIDQENRIIKFDENAQLNLKSHFEEASKRCGNQFFKLILSNNLLEQIDEDVLVKLVLRKLSFKTVQN